MTSTDDHAWVPEICTLPTVEQPLRLAAFDDLFAASVRAQQRLSTTMLRWELDPAAETTARDLIGRESSCCSFFTFTFHPGGGALRVDVEVPAEYIVVLDVLAQRAGAGIRS
jgi:hypothetical protein